MAILVNKYEYQNRFYLMLPDTGKFQKFRMAATNAIFLRNKIVYVFQNRINRILYIKVVVF